MYNPTTNGAEWIPVPGTARDLSQVEEVMALTLCNMVLHSPSAQSERLNRFREDRAWEDAEGEAGSGGIAPLHVSSHDEGSDEKVTPPLESPEGSPHDKSEDEGDDFQISPDNLQNEIGGEATVSPLQSPGSCHHFSRGCHHPCSANGADQCETEYEEGVEESERAATQDDETEEDSSGRSSSKSSSKDSSKGNADDKDREREPSEVLPPTSQESEETLLGELTGGRLLNRSTGETEKRALRRISQWTVPT